MAEIIVASAANGQQRSAFQFDTITPKKATAARMSSVNSTESLTSQHEDAEVTDETKEDVNETSEAAIAAEKSPVDVDSSSDDSGGFKTPEEKDGVVHRVKRASVVGNAAFSRSQDSDLGEPRASLGIDDLEMDYEQILSYFDNLKVSNVSNVILINLIKFYNNHMFAHFQESNA